MFGQQLDEKLVLYFVSSDRFVLSIKSFKSQWAIRGLSFDCYSGLGLHQQAIDCLQSGIKSILHLFPFRSSLSLCTDTG